MGVGVGVGIGRSGMETRRWKAVFAEREEVGEWISGWCAADNRTKEETRKKEGGKERKTGY